MERNLFFTSDTHFSHENVIKYAKRPFANVDEMNETLIKNWNNTVTKQDIIYILGDVAFERDEDKLVWMLSRLNGEKHLIEGNHDDKMTAKVKKQFQTISQLREIRVAAPELEHKWQYITLCHYAMRVWNKSHYGAFHLFGHSHGTMPDDPNSLSLDVGVDCWNYAPVSYAQIKERMKKKTFKPIDNHRRNRGS